MRLDLKGDVVFLTVILVGPFSLDGASRDDNSMKRPSYSS